VRGAVERLGPAYVKIAQAVSTRVDILSPAYLVEIERLQDRVPPFPTTLVRAWFRVRIRALTAAARAPPARPGPGAAVSGCAKWGRSCAAEAVRAGALFHAARARGAAGAGKHGGGVGPAGQPGVCEHLAGAHRGCVARPGA
jgi:hypothetical protein